jgi:aquaporin Z
MTPALWQNGLAELLGTFFLTLAALLGGLPYVAGITLGVFVYAIGGLSGCNINPAVTVGMVAARRLSLASGVVYLVAQITGALLARGFAPLIGEMPDEFHAGGGWAEFFGFAVLILTVIAVTDGYTPKAGSGIAIGAALVAGLVVSHGILNPAVALAMGEITSGGIWATFASALVFPPLYLALAHQRADAKAA